MERGREGKLNRSIAAKTIRNLRREVLQLEGDFLARTASTETTLLTLLLVVIGEAADA